MKYKTFIVVLLTRTEIYSHTSCDEVSISYSAYLRSGFSKEWSGENNCFSPWYHIPFSV